MYFKLFKTEFPLKYHKNNYKILKDKCLMISILKLKLKKIKNRIFSYLLGLWLFKVLKKLELNLPKYNKCMTLTNKSLIWLTIKLFKTLILSKLKLKNHLKLLIKYKRNLNS